MKRVFGLFFSHSRLTSCSFLIKNSSSIVLPYGKSAFVASLKENNPPKLLPVLFSGTKAQSFPNEIQNIIYRDFTDPSKYVSSLLGLDPIGLIPGVFEEFKDRGKSNLMYKLLMEKRLPNMEKKFPDPSQGTCPEVIRPPKSFDRDEILKRKREDYEPGTREWIFDALINNTKKGHAAFLLSPAGMGKSCIMAELTFRCCPSFKKKKDDCLNILAYHFFVWTDENAKSGEFALKSIASLFCLSVGSNNKGVNPLKSFWTQVEGLDETINETKVGTSPHNFLIAAENSCACSHSSKASNKIVNGAEFSGNFLQG